MNSHDAIRVAAAALAKSAITDIMYRKTISKSQNGREVFVVVFDFKKQPGVILLPASVMVEVDEKTGEAVIVESP